MRRGGRAVRIGLAILVAAVFLGLAFALASHAHRMGSEEHDPLTAVDDAGRSVAFDDQPGRVVSLAPSNTELLFAIGAGSKVVGVDACSDYPAEARDVAKVGDYALPNMEAIIALKPDLVLADRQHADLVKQMEELGLKVLILDPHTIEGVYADITLVGRITGMEKQAATVVDDMRARLDKVEETLKAIDPTRRVTVYYEVYSDPLMSVGPGTFAHEVITLAGGRNIFGDAKTGYPEISPEAVITSNPSVIVYPDFHGPEALTPAKLKARPGWDRIEAVVTGRVFGLDADIISRPGPRLADAVEAMAAILYPEEFGREGADSR